MSYLKQLDPIHHEGLRQDLRAFRTFPVDSLYAEAHEAPRQLRREKLALQYHTKLKFFLFNPTYDCILNPKYEQHKTFWPSDEVYFQRNQYLSK